jgi:hypothetical protein
MKKALLIERALASARGDVSLTELLGQLDALQNAIPSLEELNSGLASLGRKPVTAQAYQAAISENHERMVRHLAQSGISSERQREILKRYAALMGKA